MQAAVNKSGLRFFVRFSFAAGGEIMSGKPDWLRNLEEQRTITLIRNNQANEIAASHKEILQTRASDVWSKVKQSVSSTVDEAEFPGFTLSSQPAGNTAIQISVFREGEGMQRYFHVRFVPEHYRFEVIAQDGKTRLVTLFLIVRDGRLALSNGSETLPDSTIDGLVASICQKLLEPALRSYLEVQSGGEENP